MSMRVCYFGAYERDYPRNALVIAGLQQLGMTVIECHEPVWERQRDKSGAYRGFAAVVIAVRLVIAYLRLIGRYLRMPAHDVVIVGYVGQFDMLVAWALTRLRATPLVFNPLVSLFDTFCDDRGLVRPESLTGRALWVLDYLACRMADQVLLDTEQHVEYFSQTFGLPAAKFAVAPVGADDRIFKPIEDSRTGANGWAEVIFVGKLIPLHGVETILHAAALLRQEPVHFTIVGSGQQQSLAEHLVRELDLRNVSLIPWVNYEELPRFYARADICLGIFGTSAKAARVIPNKVFQGLAMGRPVLTRDGPAVRAGLRPGVEVVVCPPNDPEALAREIARLVGDADARSRLAEAGHAAFERCYSIAAIGETVVRALEEVVPGWAPGERMEWGAQPEFFGPRHRFREEYLLRAVQRFIPGNLVLDAACGAGTLARQLVRHHVSVAGLDLSPGFLQYIQENGIPPGLSLQRGDITALPYAENAFAGVIAGEVLEHLADDRPALRECWRVLRPGGICIVSVPADPRQWSWSDDWAGHVRRYSAAELRGRLEAVGFEVLSLNHWGFPLVRAFHRYVYLPRLRRSWRRNGSAPSIGNGRGLQQRIGQLFFLAFHFDRLFDRLPLGIGLIAIARKQVAERMDAAA